MLETGHTVVLNWSPKLFPLIRELSLANESAGGGTVVVMADIDKEEMVCLRVCP